MFNCKHKHKSRIDLILTEQARLCGDITDTVYTVGKYNVYRCLECKCLVWEERRDNG